MTQPSEIELEYVTLKLSEILQGVVNATGVMLFVITEENERHYMGTHTMGEVPGPAVMIEHLAKLMAMRAMEESKAGHA